MPKSHIHGSPRRFHYGSKPTDDPGNDNFYSPIEMHNASTTTYDYGCNTEIYGLIRIATDDAGSYPWLMPRSHVYGSPRRFYYGLNLTDDPGNVNFRSPIRMHYIRMIKSHNV